MVSQATTVRVLGEDVGLDEAGRRAHALCLEYNGARDAALRRGVALGEYLAAVRQQIPHGGWEPWLGRHKINKHTAAKAMRLAREYGDGKGGVDLDKIESVRSSRVRSGEIPPHHPAASTPVGEMSRRQIEEATGIRPVRRHEIRPPAFLRRAAGEGGLKDRGTHSGAGSAFADRGTHLPAPAQMTAPAGASGPQMSLLDHVRATVDELTADLARIVAAGVGPEDLAELHARLTRAIRAVERLMG